MYPLFVCVGNTGFNLMKVTNLIDEITITLNKDVLHFDGDVAKRLYTYLYDLRTRKFDISTEGAIGE